MVPPPGQKEGMISKESSRSSCLGLPQNKMSDGSGMIPSPSHTTGFPPGDGRKLGAGSQEAKLQLAMPAPNSEGN